MIIIIIKIIKLWTSLLMEWDMENNTNVIQRMCFPLVDLFSSHAYECSVLEDCGLLEQSKYKWNILCLLEETVIHEYCSNLMYTVGVAVLHFIVKKSPGYLQG
jgi:hypothetical protein